VHKNVIPIFYKFASAVLLFGTVAGVLRAQSTVHSAVSANLNNLVLNVNNFGADPTGVRDSAPAVRAAVTSAGAGPATLYFPRGTYRLASPGPGGAEECVRINNSISLMGDGSGLTIFTDDAVPACMAQFGFFYTNSVAVHDSDYSFESDFGFPVTPSSAGIASSSLTLANHSTASYYAAGQYVYVRGTNLPQPGEFHGELNRITGSGDPNTGIVKLLWPLSSDFSQDNGLQLNLVASTEVLTNIQISGITFNFHRNALLAAQVLGMQIFNNTFNYLGMAAGNEVSQFNQDRNVEFHDNIVNNPMGPALDLERNPTNWNVYGNTFAGFVEAGEAGANINFNNNNITCVNLVVCLRFGGTTGNIADKNYINSSCPYDYCHAVTDVSGSVTSPATIISNNVITANGPRAVSVQTAGTKVTGNTIYTQSTGIDIAAGGVYALNNTVTITGPSVYGCILVEGNVHNDLLQGTTCNGYDPSHDRAVWVTDNGPQGNTPLIIDGLTGSNLNIGIFLTNPSNDVPILNAPSFSNTGTAIIGTARSNH